MNLRIMKKQWKAACKAFEKPVTGNRAKSLWKVISRWDNLPPLFEETPRFNPNRKYLFVAAPVDDTGSQLYVHVERAYY